jgi:hypothetical protein
VSVRYLTFSDFLTIAESLPGDPQFDDYGPVVAAEARVRASRMETDIYGTVRLKAAALVHTLLMLDCLEEYGAEFAWSAGVEFLRINGDAVPLDHEAVMRATRAAWDRQPKVLHTIAHTLGA